MTLLEIALSNAIVAVIPAVLAIVVAKVWNNPALVRALWLLVFVKLVTPPIAPVPCFSVPSLPVTVATQVSAGVDAPGEAKPPRAGLFEQAHDRFDEPFGASPDGESHDDLFANVAASAKKDNLSSAPAAHGNTKSAWLAPQLALTRQQAIRLGVWLWLAGVLVHFNCTAMRVWKFSQLFKLASPAATCVQQRVDRLASQMGLRHAPSVRVLPGITTPMIWAPRGTHLLLPKSLLKHVDNAQLDALLTHELAHLCNGDHWVRRAEIFVSAIYWWHPIVWLAKRQIREVEEQICDAYVVSTLPDSARTYATTLVEIAGRLSGAAPVLPPAATGLSQFRSIQRRITMIMQGATSPRLSVTGWLAILAIAALLIPVAPALARPAPQQEDTAESVDKQVQQAVLELQLIAEADRDERGKGFAFEVSFDFDKDEGDHGDADVFFDNLDEEEEDEEDEEFEEAQEAVEEMLEEIREAIQEMDEEVEEAIEEAHEDLEELVDEASEAVQREMLEIDVEAIVEAAVEEAPQPVKLFVEAVAPAKVIQRQLADVRVELQEMESDDRQRSRVKREIEGFLRGHIRELSRHTKEEVRNIRREIQRETRNAPEVIQEILAEVDFVEIVDDATSETSPVVQQIVATINVPKMVKVGLAAADGPPKERQRAERETRDRQRGARHRDDEGRGRRGERSTEATARYKQLERQLDRLMEEAEAIRSEMRRIKEGKRKEDRGAR